MRIYSQTAKCLFSIVISTLCLAVIKSLAETSDARPALPDYLVLGFDESSYGSNVSTMATRIEVPHNELPLLVNVVSEFLLEEQQAIDPSDAFNNISSVEVKTAAPGQMNQVSIRGFNSFTFIDGFRVGNSNSSSIGAVSFATEVANIERIEVLKGPAATLYGRGLPGGVINYVTKKPQAERASTLTAQFGSNSLFRTVADTTGSFDDDAALQYRVIASLSERDSYRDEVEQSAAALYPSIQWDISDQATLLVRSEYQKVTYTPDQGALFLIDGSAAPASSQSFFYGRPDDELKAEQYGINMQLDLYPNDLYTMRALIGYRHAEQSGTSTLGTYVDGAVLERVTEVSDDSRDDFVLQVDHIFEFDQQFLETVDLGHRILLTADWQRSHIAPSSVETPLDFFDIENGQSLGASPFAGPPNDFMLTSTDLGIGLQDLISINERLHLLLGIRYDQSELKFDLEPFPFDGHLQLENWSYRTGFIYQLSDALSVFANMGTAFRPTFRINDAGASLFETQESIQYEVGIKVDLADSWLTLSAAIFQLTNKDVVISEIVSTDQESYGAELDLSARLTDRTTLLFNYAVIQTQYSDGPFEGNELFGTPTQGGGLWINHDLIQEQAERLSVSLGMNYKASFYATDANNVELPDSFQVNAGVHYQIDRWQFRLNAYNLFDEESFVASPNVNDGDPTAPIYALPTPPRSLRFSVGYRF